MDIDRPTRNVSKWIYANIPKSWKSKFTFMDIILEMDRIYQVVVGFLASK